MNILTQALIGLHYMLKIEKVGDSFGVEPVPKEIIKFIENKDIIAKIFRLQSYDSIMCGYYCIEFINYMLKGKTLLDYTNLFSPNDFKKNDQVIKRLFKK